MKLHLLAALCAGTMALVQPAQSQGLNPTQRGAGASGQSDVPADVPREPDSAKPGFKPGSGPLSGTGYNPPGTVTSRAVDRLLNQPGEQKKSPPAQRP